MKCKAAIAWGPKQALEIEEVEVDNNGKIIEVEQEEKQEKLKIHENQTEINF